MGNKSPVKSRAKKRRNRKMIKTHLNKSVFRRGPSISSLSSLSGSHSSLGEIINFHKTMEDIPLKI